MGFNHSPWLYELDKNRVRIRLSADVQTDVVIVGAGIAGISTAFFTLKHTDKKVVVLERSVMAHGATGHNAGQVVSYFERGFSSLVEEFGPAMASDGQKAIEDAWGLLDEMYTEASLVIPFTRFLGYAGVTSQDQVMWHLRSSTLRQSLGMHVETMLLADDVDFATTMPEEYSGLYRFVPREEVLGLLETTMANFIAVLPYQKGCINSALFCQEIHAYLQKTYGDRYALYEHAPVNKIIMGESSAVLDAESHTVTAERVVLCTNGFRDLHIINSNGLKIDAKYHHMISGKVGFMSGYLERMNKPPMAISYFTDPVASADNSYFYLTRRLYEFRKVPDYNLISIGGPEEDLSDVDTYSWEKPYPHSQKMIIDAFIRRVYNIAPNKDIHYAFTWHGLMGYTRNGIRLIGPEPENGMLLYNLGCNGVGILPSIHGGRVIAKYINNEPVERSIFDVPQKDPGVASGITIANTAVNFVADL